MLRTIVKAAAALALALYALGASAEVIRIGFISSYSGLNEEFHEFILVQSGNEYAADLLRRLSVPLFRQQFTGLFTTEGLFDRNEDHRRITEALLAEDPVAAERAMREHVGNGIRAMLTLPDDVFA